MVHFFIGEFYPKLNTNQLYYRTDVKFSSNCETLNIIEIFARCSLAVKYSVAEGWGLDGLEGITV